MRKNNRSRLLTFVLIAALFMAVAIPAYAAMTGKDISVFTGVRIFVDGRELQPIDVKGNEVEAFIYEGTTYVPLRAVGEALGAEVSWDKESKTVYLNTERPAMNRRTGSPGSTPAPAPSFTPAGP